MTGRYGFRTGWYSNKMKKNTPLCEENLLFSEVLKEAGYRTAVAGKWQLPGMPPEYGFDEHQLWAYAQYLPEGTVYTSGIESDDPDKYNYHLPSRYWHPSILRNGEYIPTEPDDYGPDFHTDFIIDFISRHQDVPFLVYYPMILTHDPFFPTPASITGGNDKWVSDMDKNFKSNVEYMDHCINRIVNALENMNLRENTVIIFTADNGTLKYGKGKVTERGARVPLVVNCPGTVKELGSRDELIDFTDILPTMAELAGTTLPENYIHDGRSFAPLLVGEPYEERDWIFSYLDYRRTLRDRRWLMEIQGGFVQREGRWWMTKGKFYDCGDSRDGVGYKDVTGSNDTEVVEAMERFRKILLDKPAPERP
jgi:arylsulfatase A